MNKLIKKLTGSIVALITPMQKSSRKIDYGKFKELILWHMVQKTNGIVVAGSTGESASLEHKEFIKLLELAKLTANNKISIIAGTGTCNLQVTIKKTIIAKELGADAALVVTPYYSKPTQNGLFLYFEQLAAHTNLPIILYNVPSRTGCDLLPTTVARLAQIKNIVGIKEATGKLERVAELKRLCNDNFILLSGDDPSFVEFMLLGGMGVISVTANICPNIINKICCSIIQDDNAKIAKTLNAHLEKLHHVMTIEANPIPIKWLMAHLGKIQEAYRLPLTNLSKEYQTIVLDAYNNITNITELQKTGVQI